jgi:hypothetical protein
VTDYLKTTGSTGKMMIRDLGTVVEFWFKAGYESDWSNDLDFNWTANGSTTAQSISYPTGAEWKKVGQVTINTSQTVTFRLLDATGTSGMGGPTTFNQYLERGTIPGPPTTPSISSITANSVYATFSDGSNGGDTIDDRQIGYSLTTQVADGTIISSDRSTTITGLLSGRRYYFWARTHNSKGWSNWSGRSTAVTLKVPDAPSRPLLSSVTATSVDLSFTANGNGGSTITAYQIGYGTSSSTPSSIVSARSPQYVTGLQPGTVYYFWVRARNSVGWSAWSPSASTRTVAGAYVKVGKVWKLAVPYVNVGGTWRPAEAWVRNVGVWKRTT